MKINNLQAGKIHKLYQNQKKNALEKNTEKKTDKMDISIKAQEIKEIKASLKELPDVRQEKIAEIKTAIKNDEYQVNPRLLAEKILKDFTRE